MTICMGKTKRERERKDHESVYERGGEEREMDMRRRTWKIQKL